MNADVLRALSSFVLACLLPVILVAGSCVACFSIVSQNPASMCCKHRNPCQDKASQSDCLDQAANPGQVWQTNSVALAQAAQAIPEPVIEPVTAMARRVIAVHIPPGGKASPPDLFVLHSALLV
jgi:hypothetical protein